MAGLDRSLRLGGDGERRHPPIPSFTWLNQHLDSYPVCGSYDSYSDFMASTKTMEMQGVAPFLCHGDEFASPVERRLLVDLVPFLVLLIVVLLVLLTEGQ